MATCIVDWKRVFLLYILHILSHSAAVVIWVNLEAPKYVEYQSTVTLICNHSVSENVLHKIEFIRNGNKIFQYIKDRNPAIIEHQIPGAKLKRTNEMNVIMLKDVGFEAAGDYSCDVSMTTPIYTMGSNSVDIQVIVPQNEDPRITFKKPHYVVGEILEANCTSSPARPAPHLTWFINGKEVDVSLIKLFHIKMNPEHMQLMTTVSQLSIEVSALHAGDNGRLEMGCNSTIPTYPAHNGQYADFKSITKSIKIISTPVHTSSGSSSPLVIDYIFILHLSTISFVISIIVKEKMII